MGRLGVSGSCLLSVRAIHVISGNRFHILLRIDPPRQRVAREMYFTVWAGTYAVLGCKTRHYDAAIAHFEQSRLELWHLSNRYCSESPG